MAFDVFISYPHQTKPVADAVCAKLEAEGIRCWIAPRDISPSAEWAASIVEAINGCRVMVLVFSSHANSSKQVHREVQLAFDDEKPVIPFRIEDVMPEGSLAYYMPSIHWLDALAPPIEQHLAELAEKIMPLVRVSGDGVAPQSFSSKKPRADIPQTLPWYIRSITAVPFRWLAAAAIVLCVAFAVLFTQLPFRHYFPADMPDNFDIGTPTPENPRLESFSYTPNSVTPPFAVPTQWTRMRDAGADYWIAKNAEETLALRFNILRRINNDDCTGTVVSMQGSDDNQVLIPDIQNGCQNHEVSFRVTGIPPWQDLGEVKFGN